jgi:hypothetical protein
MLTNRELATVLAALRYWQRTRADCILYEPDYAPVSMASHEDAIATDEGRVEPLNAAEIGALCERLNLQQLHPRYVLYDFDADELATTTIYASYAEAAEDAAELPNVLIVEWPAEKPGTSSVAEEEPADCSESNRGVQEQVPRVVVPSPGPWTERGSKRFGNCAIYDANRNLVADNVDPHNGPVIAASIDLLAAGQTIDRLAKRVETGQTQGAAGVWHSGPTLTAVMIPVEMLRQLRAAIAKAEPAAEPNE